MVVAPEAVVPEAVALALALVAVALVAVVLEAVVLEAAVLEAAVPVAVEPEVVVREVVAQGEALVLALLAARRVRARRPALAIWVVPLAPASQRAQERAVLEQPTGPHPTGPPPMEQPAAGTPAATMGGEPSRKELAPIPCARSTSTAIATGPRPSA